LQPDRLRALRRTAPRRGRPTLDACTATHTHAQCDAPVNLENAAVRPSGERYIGLVTVIAHKLQPAQNGHKCGSMTVAIGEIVDKDTPVL
jgi:hypothetical protein